MGELIIKSNLSQDWISFALISNIVFIYLLINLNPVRTSRLLNFLKIDFYLSKYNSDRETQYLNLYNIIGTLFIINTACLSLIFFSEKIIFKKTYFFEFCFLILLIIIFLITRYFITSLITRKSKILKKIKPLLFKNFTINLQFACAYFVLIFTGFYSEILPFLLYSVVVIISILYFFSQSRIFYSLFRFHPKEVIYFILYLCTFKLIPWYCFYLYVLEPRF